MLLAIDVGNTQTVLGLFSGSELVAHWRIATDSRRTADELAVVVMGLLSTYRSAPDAVGDVESAAPDAAREAPTEQAAEGVSAPGVSADGAGERPAADVTGIAMCSTVPSLLHELRDMVWRYYPGRPTVVIEPGVRTGVPILMDNPREVGADRIANALAASQLFGGPSIIVDFGTATTFDVVSTRGEYVGGAIAPGIEISLEALGERGAQLRMVELARPRSVIAKNTVEALQSGAVHGFAGQVDGLVERMAAELELTRDDLQVIATGGLAPLVIKECRSVDRYEPWLTLIGLRLVFERNT